MADSVFGPQCVEQQILDSVIVRKGWCTVVLRYLYAEGKSLVSSWIVLFLEVQYSKCI